MKDIAITENHLYRKVFAKGKKCRVKYVCVYVLKDYASKRLMQANPAKKTINRIGLSVSKSLGSAVTRNRAKRLIRAALREVRGEQELSCGWLIVIHAQTSVADAGVKSYDVARDLRCAFKKLGLLD